MPQHPLTETERARIFSKYGFPPEGSFEHAVLQMEISRIIDFEMKNKRKKKSVVAFKDFADEAPKGGCKNASNFHSKTSINPAEVLAATLSEVLSAKHVTERCREISDEVGNQSVSSVSSVHTSDLSSYDDEFSLTSDEELRLKRQKVSLKSMESMYKQGRIVEWCEATLQRRKEGQQE